MHLLICMYPSESDASECECFVWFRQNDLTKIDCYKSANTQKLKTQDRVNIELHEKAVEEGESLFSNG